MTRPAGDVVQVIGRAHSGDPVTATAVALHARLVRLGRRARVTAADPGTVETVERYQRAMDGHLIVHSVDGGHDLLPLVGDLGHRSITLVHHGSGVGSDRRALRALRSSTHRSLAADAAGREELRGLGFRNVGVLGGDVALDPFVDVVADGPTVDNLAQHPGPLLLCIGRIAPSGGVETLLEAFGEVLTHVEPSAVLSVCGPSTHSYRARLHRFITTRGLVACEIVEPTHDGQVLARLDRADAVISLRPAGFDPYLRAAAQRGLPVVAPVAAATDGIDPTRLAPLPRPGTTKQLAAALAAALALSRRSAGDAPIADGGALDALGLT